MSWLRNGRSLVRCSHSFSRFRDVVENYDKFDAGTKNAILKASSSVVSIISRIGDKVIFIGSGTIIKCDVHDGCFYGTILTSATFLQGPAGEASVLPNLKIDVYLPGGNLCKGQVLTYDFHYNIATVKVKSDSPLSTAKIRYIDDTVAIDSDMSAIAEANSFMQYGEGAASTWFNLCPGELVIALSRFSEEPHEIMAAPGLFSCDDCSHDCKELYLTTCTVNKAAVGGPLVNCYGEVIGVNFISCPFNAFLPINIAFKCLEDLNKNRRVPRPWLGVSISNLYTAKLEKLDGLTRKFPHVVKGVIIDKVKSRRVNTCMVKTKALYWTFWSSRKWLKAKVINKNIWKLKRTQKRVRKMKIRKRKRTQKRVRKMKVNQESPASVAGLCADDVIISCDGKSIGSQLELIEALWNKEGKAVELVVVRPETGQRSLTVTIGTSPKMNKWHVPLVGFLSILEDRLAVERRDKMKVDEME